MNQSERLDYLIRVLLKERDELKRITVPDTIEERQRMFRSLVNLRPATPASEEFLQVQDAYLEEELRRRKVTSISELIPLQGNLYVWRGDITTLAADAIVNAANSQMLGCFVPCHRCIDNAIHTFAGVELRLACVELMEKQGFPEPAGQAKITPAFCLPSRYVLHTVGPVISGALTQRDCDQLASCYRSCLKLAGQYPINSVAFCCISTGEFHFPNHKAAEIAVQTVQEYLYQSKRSIKVIFNVFKESDETIYRDLLGHTERGVT